MDVEEVVVIVGGVARILGRRDLEDELVPDLVDVAGGFLGTPVVAVDRVEDAFHHDGVGIGRVDRVEVVVTVVLGDVVVRNPGRDPLFDFLDVMEVAGLGVRLDVVVIAAIFVDDRLESPVPTAISDATGHDLAPIVVGKETVFARLAFDVWIVPARAEVNGFRIGAFLQGFLRFDRFLEQGADLFHGHAVIDVLFAIVHDGEVGKVRGHVFLGRGNLTRGRAFARVPRIGGSRGGFAPFTPAGSEEKRQRKKEDGSVFHKGRMMSFLRR